MRGILKLHAASVALVLAIFLGPLAATPAAACSPNQGGKYANQVYRMHVPGDRAKYGNCNDYGIWNGTSYAGHSNIPKGYWVYAYPYWYVWARKATAQPAVNCSPNQNGKYSGQLYRMHVPGDRGKYGTCRDYGIWNGTSYAGHHNIPRGYWVYAYPYWYVWARQGAASSGFKSRWDRLGGNWTTGWVPNHTYQGCGHQAAGCSCGGRNYCGTYRSGDSTYWWPRGCGGPRWTIRCTSVPQ